MLAAEGGEDVAERARELLRPPDASTPLGKRLISLMQSEPGLVVARGRLARLL